MVAKALGMSLAMMAYFLFFYSAAYAEIPINLEVIKAIESGGDPDAVNDETGCYGLYQISEICLKDFNQFHPKKYVIKDLFRPAVNEMIASWYFGRIKEMLGGYGIPVNPVTLIASYNWGIGHVAVWAKQGMRFEELPAETRRYIEKYQKGVRPRS